MAIRGQRVLIDLSSSDDDEGEVKSSRPSDHAVDVLGDVLERKSNSVTNGAPPPAPRASSTTGFPTHRKRTARSRFRVSRDSATSASPASDQPAAVKPISNVPLPAATIGGQTSIDDEKRQIDEENRQRLSEMTDGEIQEERQELLESLGPGLLQALLRRSKLEQGGSDADFPGIDDKMTTEETPLAQPKRPKGGTKKVTFDLDEERSAPIPTQPKSGDDTNEHTDMDFDTDEPRVTQSEHDLAPPTGSIHFPRPSQPPSLDPNSPSFLEDLHKKYFPSLPSDPEKLEWMKPTSSSSSSYSTSQSGIEPKDIRFSFRGTLIPPSEAALIPVTAGLHNHGDSPDAAGYTIPELARLARSSVPAQRCVAFQTLGRILYRLGRGEFGDPSEGEAGTVGAEDTLAELARGLWREMEAEKVVEICAAESEGTNGGRRHVSAQAYATEAVWLWQKGGGRRWRTD